MIDDQDYDEGFRQGYRAIKGANTYIPHIPYRGHVPYGRTAFQLGLMRGIERAKGWSLGDLRSKNELA